MKLLLSIFIKKLTYSIKLSFISLVFFIPSFSFAGSESTSVYDVIEHINAFYVDEVDPKKLNNLAIDALLKQLDPHSEFLDETELADLFNITNGQYTGLGIEVEIREEHIVIVTSIANSPAAQAGLKQGDILLTVNGETVLNKPIKRVAKLIDQSKSSMVRLSIARAGFASPLNFDLTREKIDIETVKSELTENGYGYIRIASFNNHTLHDVARHLARLINQNGMNLNGLLIDLRDNPGGILDSAIAISDLFLTQGTIVSTKGRFFDANQKYMASKNDILEGAPMVVLINKGSASAAEILAGALKDNNRATVVGTRSYGKGSVQSLIPLGNGQTALKLTTAKYYTPSGLSIDGIGISPDIAIEQTSLSETDKLALMEMSKGEDNQVLLNTFKDIQLLKAQKILAQ